MVLKNSSYQEWTKSNQTIKIKPWKSKDLEDLEIKQSIKQSKVGRFGRLKDWRVKSKDQNLTIKTQIKSNNQSNKINQTLKVGRFGNQTIKPWKFEIKQSNIESWKIWKAERLKNFESCKLRKLNISKVGELKSGKFKLKAGKRKDELDFGICQILAE